MLYPSTVAIADNREALDSLLQQLDVAQTELDGLAVAGTSSVAFQQQQRKRDSLVVRIQAKVARIEAMLYEQDGNREADQATVMAARQLLSRVEKRIASYHGLADIARNEVAIVQGELETSERHMNSEYLQMLLMFGGMILIVGLNAGPLVTAGTAPQEIVIVVGVGVLLFYFTAQYVLKWRK